MARDRDSLLTFGEPAKYLKLSKSTLYRLAPEGEVPPARRSAGTGAFTVSRRHVAEETTDCAMTIPSGV
jgi:excisionase family DNA binding protein